MTTYVVRLHFKNAPIRTIDVQASSAGEALLRGAEQITAEQSSQVNGIWVSPLLTDEEILLLRYVSALEAEGPVLLDGPEFISAMRGPLELGLIRLADQGPGFLLTVAGRAALKGAP